MASNKKRNPSSSPMSENHQRNVGSLSPSEHRLLLSLDSMAEYYPIEFSQLGINNIPHHDHRRYPSIVGPVVNPSFPPDHHHQTLYDPSLLLESELFSRLSLSSYPSPPALGGGGRGGGVSFLENIDDYLPASLSYTDMDLQRMRIQSAVMGQTHTAGLYMQQQQQQPNGNYGGGLMNDHHHNHHEISLEDYFRRLHGLMNPSDNELFTNNNNNGSSWPISSNIIPAAARNTIRQQNGFPASHHDSVNGYPNSGNGNRFVVDNRNFQQRSSNRGERERERNSASSVSMSANSLFRRPPQSLEELRGRLYWVAKDKNGCRYLQDKFGGEDSNPEETEMIFSELKDHVLELMVHPFGNYLMQKICISGTADQINHILLSVFSDDRNFMAMCLDTHGTRVIQTLLENLKKAEQRSLVMSFLRHITLIMTKNTNGHHVIERCLQFFPNEDNKHLLNVVADNCLEIATDRSGCCVLQQCLRHAQGEAKERLLAEISANALVLSEHPYGNYVVQFILGMKIPHVTADIIVAQLGGSYVSVSMNKYGSNVVEKCLRDTGEDKYAALIIREMINSPNFLMLLQDPYGNYVAQSALEIAKGSLRHEMASLIQIHYPFLHSHPHGKRVLSRIRGSSRARV